MKPSIFIPYPSMRDYREIELLNNRLPYQVVFDSCTRGVLEYEIAKSKDAQSVAQLIEQGIESRVKLCKRYGMHGVGYSSDYPGNPVSVLIAKQCGLVAPDPELILKLHHKYYSRELQKQHVPHATPEYALIHFDGTGKDVHGLAYPFFIKPVKSYLSMCAYAVDSAEHLDEILGDMEMPPMFIEPFNYLLERYCAVSFDGYHMIAESFLSGEQVTLEGYVYEGNCTIMGITDSIMYPGTISFQRFEYPSRMPDHIQERMEIITHQLIAGLKLDNTMFNIEFMYDQEKDLVSIIEVNPRMAHQFADLYEKVDGTNGYEIMLSIAAGMQPQFKKRQGEFACAASFVMRVFENMRVLRVPQPQDIAYIQQELSDARIELYAVEGAYLDEQDQDVHSYKYAIVNIGGNNRQDLLSRYEQCKNMLNIILEPV